MATIFILASSETKLGSKFHQLVKQTEEQIGKKDKIIEIEVFYCPKKGWQSSVKIMGVR